VVLTNAQRAAKREKVIAQRLLRQDRLAAAFEKLPPEVRRRKIRKHGRKGAVFHIDSYIKRVGITPLLNPHSYILRESEVDVLFLSRVDYACLGYTLAESLKSVGAKAVALSSKASYWRTSSDQASVCSEAAITAAVAKAHTIVWMHSLYRQLPKGLLTGKQCVVFHGGTRYRRSFKGLNALFKDVTHLSLVQTGELLGKGAKNEHWLLPPVDTKGIEPDYSFKSDEKIIIGHFTSHLGSSRALSVKGTPSIKSVIASLKKSELGNCFEFRSNKPPVVPWRENLHRMAECDIYIESLSQGEETNRNKHDWSITALEACALGCVTISNFLFEKRYQKEYGEHGLVVANTRDALKETLRKLLQMDREELLAMKHKARQWVEEKHSYEAVGRRLKDILKIPEKREARVIISKSTKDMRKPIISDLVACKTAFDQVKIPWVITDGIVLGYIRHNDIIPEDTDLDLGIFRKITDSEWDFLFAALRKAGFSIKNKKQDFIYGKRSTKFNLWLFHKKGNFYESFPATTPGLKFVEKAEWYDKIQMVDFLGSAYPMPNNLEDYIVCRYGKDWKEARYTHAQWRLEKFGTNSSKFEPDVWLKSRCGPNGDLWPRIMKVKDKP